MTLSPGQNVQPKRSMRVSPGGFSAVWSSILSERAPRPPRFIGQSTWMSRIGSSRKRDRAELSNALFRVRGVDEIEVAAFDRGEVGHKALIDAMRVNNDPAFGGLAEDLGQADHRHG